MNQHEPGTDRHDAARWHDELDAAVRTLEVPTDRLGSAARSRGRVVRRRRRAGAAAAVLAAAAVVGLGAGQVLGEGPADPGFAADPSGGTSEAAEVAPPTGFADTEPGWWSMPVAEMETRLRALLPADVALTDVALEPIDPAPGEEDREVQGYLHATVESPASGGPGEIEIFLRAPASALPEPTEVTSTGADGNATTYALADHSSNRRQIRCGRTRSAECTPMRGTDGSDHGIYYVGDSQGSTYFGAHVLTADEGLVQVMVSDDASGEKWSAPVTAEQPALTVQQVRAIAESPTWQDWTPPVED